MVASERAVEEASGVDGRRPRPAPGIRVELSETAAGWVLTVRCGTAAAAALRAAGRELDDHQVSICIRPNLVPGGAFEIGSILLAVDDPGRAADPPPATTDGTAALDSRPSPSADAPVQS